MGPDVENLGAAECFGLDDGMMAPVANLWGQTEDWVMQITATTDESWVVPGEPDWLDKLGWVGCPGRVVPGTIRLAYEPPDDQSVQIQLLKDEVHLLDALYKGLLDEFAELKAERDALAARLNPAEQVADGRPAATPAMLRTLDNPSPPTGDSWRLDWTRVGDEQ